MEKHQSAPKEVDSVCSPDIAPYVKGRHKKPKYFNCSNQSKSGVICLCSSCVYQQNKEKLNGMYSYFGKHA
jgi:hypothetical protein